MIWKAVLTVEADVKNLAMVRRFIEDQAAPEHADPSHVHDMLLAVTEMVTNIIIHGYQRRPQPIEIAVGMEDKRLVVCLRDWAPPFDPTLVAAPDLTLPLARRPLGGMGIHMTRQLVDSMTYRRTAMDENELILVKNVLE